MNGWRLNQVHLDKYVRSHRFQLGAITSSNRGLYRCRYGVEPPTSKLTELNRWTMLSNPVEVTGTGKRGRNGVRRQRKEVGWKSSHLCHLLALSLILLIYQEGMFCCPQRLVNNDCHRVLGTSLTQRSVRLPVSFSEPHTHTPCCSCPPSSF